MKNLDFTFSHPYLLLFLEIIPIMLIYYFRYYRNQRSIIQISTLTGFRNYRKSFRQKLIHFPFILRTLSVFCLLIAMADPKSIRYERARDQGPEETLILMDISDNTLARDFKPNRFIALKTSLDHYLDKHPGQSFGLVTMGKSVRTQVPITEDIQTFKNALEALEPEKSGTLDLAEGLKTSLDNFSGSTSPHKQILLFLSTSPDQGSSLLSLAREGKKDSIAIYPFILSSEGIGSFPRIQNGDTTYTDKVIDIREGALRELADGSDGLFFRSRDDQELDLNFLKLEEVLDRLKTKKAPNYQGILPFAWIAGFLLILEIISRYTFLKSLP